MDEQKITGKRTACRAILRGAVYGTLASLAVSTFKDSNTATTIVSIIAAAAVGAWSFGKTVSERDRRRTVCCLIPALLFAAFSVIGFCFAMDSTPERLYASKTNLLKAAAAFCGYVMIFYAGLQGLFSLLSEHRTYSNERPDREIRGYGKLLVRRPFQTAFLTLLLGYLPYMIASWPALFMGDCQTIIPQMFGAAPLTTHHPVPYTLFLCGVLKAGKELLNSWNAGAFAFAMLQTLAFLAVMSYSIQVLIRKANCSWKWAVVLEVYYLVSPRVSNCMFVITKDVWYAACLLLFGIAVFGVLREGWTKENTVQMALAAAGILIFRKDGFYVLLLSSVTYLLFNRKLRKGMPALLIAVLGLHLLFNQVIYPAAGIEKGSIKEMLSIPLQQTARCTKYLGDSLTEEEKNEILDLFFFDSIEEMGAAYDPSLVDYIKFRFPEQVDGETLNRYLHLWAKMGMKYPATYLNAFINNYFEYVYPGCIFMQCSYDWSETCFGRVNEKIGSDFHYPEKLRSFRNGMENVRERVFETYPFRLINMPGMTTWFLLTWVFWLVYSGKTEYLMLAVPLLIVMLVCFASPCNGYYCRYQYPLLAYLPWAILAERNGKISENMRKKL
ncbi:MAG: hypothetical protein IJV30_10885 [Oscillospiraceae bacterium]|nr:hypothetical protein [Oscillospiraceae bacterium]